MTSHHLVHVGFHKTGSTWLQRSVFPTVRGATYVSGHAVFRELAKNLVKDDTFYEAAWKGAIADVGDRVVLSHESFVAGGPWAPPWGERDPERNADRLARVVPGAKILVVTRDARSLASSLFAQHVQEGGYLSPDQFEASVLANDYLDVDAATARYRARFEEVLVLTHESLRKDPAAWVRELAAFANLELDVPQRVGSVNVSVSGWRLEALRAWNRVFRVSPFNPSPPCPLPHAGVMRNVLQRWR